MTTARIREADLVECDQRGQRFYGRVIGRPPGGGTGLVVEPLISALGPRRTVKPREVIGHYRRAKGSA